MIFVILVVCISICFLGDLVRKKTRYVSTLKSIGETTSILGAIGAGASFVAAIILCVMVTNSNVIDDKIAMYQEENTRIEEQIAVAVKEYMDFESETYTNLSPDSAITLTIVYPELRSNELVQNQIVVYMNNNETIKYLKSKKISDSVYRWWLYFGKER